MAVRDGRGDVKQTTTGFRGPLMVQSLTSAKSKFLSLLVVGVVSALVGSEGLNRFSSFVSAFAGSDSSLSMLLPVISVIGVVN